MRPAFTLTELAVVILIVAIISAIAVPAVVSRSSEAKLAATVGQMLQIEKVVRQYRAVHGSWPKNTAHGVVPSEIQADLPGVDFSQTPLGGAYDWNGPGTSLSYIGISTRLERRKFSADDLRRLDAQLDDGNLSTGYVRLLNGIYFQLCLEES